MRSLLLLAFIGMTVQAQVPSKPRPVEKPAVEAGEPAEPKWFKPDPNPIVPKDGKVTIPLTLTAAAVKKPLSRYYLTPQYTEMKPGNRVPTFMRAYMEQENFYSKVPRENREYFNRMRLEDLPLDEIKQSGCIGGLAYRDPNVPFPSRGRPLGDVDEGARQLSSDWQIWYNLREDGIGTLLPEVQKMREHASCLKVRMRYEIRTGDIDKAIYTARTFNGLATSFESHPTMIGFLVGIAIQGNCFVSLEELIQQPACPNLYWSFTEMPATVLNPRICVGGEPLISEIHFAPFMQAKEPMSEETLQNRLREIDQLVFRGDSADNKKRVRYSLDVGIRATNKKKLEAARKLLIDTGMTAKFVNGLPDLQLLVTADIRQYELFLDDTLSIQNLPHLEAMKRGDAIDQASRAAKSPICDWLLPSNRKVKAAHTRIQQWLAYLRIVEAIRLYAHDHAGQLPAKLADCSVPLPLDPVTEKPFEYSVKEGVATLHGGDPSAPPPGTTDPGQMPTGFSNRYYEIRIKK